VIGLWSITGQSLPQPDLITSRTFQSGMLIAAGNEHDPAKAEQANVMEPNDSTCTSLASTQSVGSFAVM
jgi:hypothetical protein